MRVLALALALLVGSFAVIGTAAQCDAPVQLSVRQTIPLQTATLASTPVVVKVCS